MNNSQWIVRKPAEYMKHPGDSEDQHACGDCGDRKPSYFCNLSPPTLLSLRAIKLPHAHPKGARLFIEGQQAKGVFMLCSGRVKLTTHSRNGKALILQVVEPGEVLGLGATMSGLAHESTAEVIESCQVNFIRKSDFFRFLEQNAEAGMNAIQQLSHQYNTAYAQIRSIGLSTCVADKLAKLLLEWSKADVSIDDSVHLKVKFSHEEIAEMIGTSRETVTRALKDFRERGLIEISGSDLCIRNKRALELTIGNGGRGKSPLPVAQIGRSNGHSA